MKARDRSMILLILGALFLTPPLAGAFDVELRFYGAPASVLYVFGVWALLIISAARIAQALDPEDAAETVETPRALDAAADPPSSAAAVETPRR